MIGWGIKGTPINLTWKSIRAPIIEDRHHPLTGIHDPSPKQDIPTVKRLVFYFSNPLNISVCENIIFIRAGSREFGDNRPVITRLKPV
jgi:hypothetical protein